MFECGTLDNFIDVCESMKITEFDYQIGLEGLGSAVRFIWEKVIAFFKWIGKKIASIFSGKGNSTGTVEKVVGEVVIDEECDDVISESFDNINEMFNESAEHIEKTVENINNIKSNIQDRHDKFDEFVKGYNEREKKREKEMEEEQKQIDEMLAKLRETNDSVNEKIDQTSKDLDELLADLQSGNEAFGFGKRTRKLNQSKTANSLKRLNALNNRLISIAEGTRKMLNDAGDKINNRTATVFNTLGKMISNAINAINTAINRAKVRKMA